jgi:DNA invertase Pin-like site-specific DNA recombinase
MRNAIIYTRVSTDEQEEKGYSLRDQKARLEKYCSEKGFEVIKHYEDGHSAKTFERPEFIKLLAFVKSNKGFIQKLFVVKWDRFSRDMAGALAMINTLKKYGVEVEAIEQPLDDDIPENLLMKAIYLATPQVENARRSLNTKNGMRKALKEGRWMATAPFGYKNSRDNNNKPVINIKEEKAALVREAFELYATGVYEKEELRKKLKPKGMSLSKNSFSEMLRNPVYCGKIRVPEYKDEA